MNLIKSPVNIKYSDLCFLDDYENTVYTLLGNLPSILTQVLGNTITITTLTGLTYVDFVIEFSRKYRNHYFNEQFINMLKYECVGNDDFTENEFYQLLFKSYKNYTYNYPDDYFKPFTNLIMVSNHLLKSCVYKNSANWVAKMNVYNAEYNPLNNYSLTEDEDIKSKITNSHEVNQYTFNTQDEPLPIGTDKTTTEGSNDDNKRHLVKSGNVGVTSSQEMILSELKLRNYKLADEIMSDIAHAFFKFNVS